MTNCRAGAIALAVAAALSSGPAMAKDGEAQDRVDGVHVASSLAFRAAPLGLVLQGNAGYRLGLFDSPSMLLDGTYVEPGVTTQITPSSAKAGLFFEALPIAALHLRFRPRR